MPVLMRVSTAKFKYNMRPYVDKAKAGAEVIVTCDGRDDFRVVPIVPSKPRPLPIGSAWHNPDENERVFKSLEADRESLA